MTISEAISAVNLVAVIVFLLLSGALTAVLVRRFLLYKRANWPIPILLKRNLIFFGGLGGLILESVILRVVGGDLFTADTLLRLVFVLQYDVVAALLFLYVLKVEALDMNDPNEK